MRMRARWARVTVVLLLLGGAYLAAQPWIDCAFPLGIPGPNIAQICSFGTGIPGFDRTGPGPLWWRPVLAAGYVIAAIWIARRELVFG